MPPPVDPSTVSTIVVRLTNWVGDCVMNTPFLARLRHFFPGARIVCLGRKHVASLLAPHPDVDEVVVIDDQSAAGRAAMVARLRELRADLGFLLPNNIKSAWLFRRGGVKRTVGYARDARRWLLTDPVTLRPEDLAVHEVKYYLRLLHPWETGIPVIPPLKLQVPEKERLEMQEWLRGEGVGERQAVIGVNPAAFFGTAKRWMPERYAETARRLAEELDARVVVTGLPTEKDVAQEVCDLGGAGFINGAGRMSLRQLMAFLACCRLFLTNDSGAMHIAAALGTPLVAVFGSTDWVTTAPIGAHCRIVRVDTPCAPCILRHCPIDHRCMTGVSVDMVQATARELLRK